MIQSLLAFQNVWIDSKGVTLVTGPRSYQAYRSYAPAHALEQSLYIVLKPSSSYSACYLNDCVLVCSRCIPQGTLASYPGSWNQGEEEEESLVSTASGSGCVRRIHVMAFIIIYVTLLNPAPGLLIAKGYGAPTMLVRNQTQKAVSGNIHSA